jgi:hypothetical protein
MERVGCNTATYDVVCCICSGLIAKNIDSIASSKRNDDDLFLQSPQRTRLSSQM